MQRFDISLAALVAALGVSAPDLAAAQQQPGDNFARDRNVSVRERPKPEYDAAGIPFGNFRMYPELILAPEYNDNVFAVDTATGTSLWSIAIKGVPYAPPVVDGYLLVGTDLGTLYAIAGAG